MLFTGSAHAAEDDFDAVKKAAEQGHADAQFTIGVMYARGEGAPEDDVEAERWYRQAAEQGHVDAQYNLGVMYDNGEGVPEDDAEAVRWYRQAAEQGHALAQNNLGLMYDNGEGVPENDAEAVRWYRQAAEQGQALAQHNLGVMYAMGGGVFEDDIQAYAWISIAAAQGVENAKEVKEILTGEMTRAEITEAQKLSRIYWEAYGPSRIPQNEAIDKLDEQKRLEAKERARQEQEQKRLEAEEWARQEEELKDRSQRERIQKEAATALQALFNRIATAVEEKWRVNGGRGLKALVRVKVGRNGDVQSAKVIKSSGDRSFDESAEWAIKRASPLPFPTDPSYYEYISEFNFLFDPGG